MNRTGEQAEAHQSARFSEKGYSEASVQWILDDRRTVNHNFRSSKPPMSSWVKALNSFVLLACEVVSVFSPLPNQCSDGIYQWPTTSSVFYLKNAVLEVSDPLRDAAEKYFLYVFICSLSSLLRLVLPNIRKQLFTIIRTAFGRDYEENTQ